MSDLQIRTYLDKADRAAVCALWGETIPSPSMGHVQRELTTRGCVKINLQIEGRNAGVVAFYEKPGFKIEDRIRMGRVLS